MKSRILPIETLPDALDQKLRQIMPAGLAPLKLFRIFAKNPRILNKLNAANLLDEGALSLREREIIITVTTALCRAEYEWGVHITFFTKKANFTDAEIRSLALGDPEGGDWSEREATLFTICRQLNENMTIDEALFQKARSEWSEGEILEILALAGFYRMISYFVNVSGVEHEDFGARFEDYTRQQTV